MNISLTRREFRLLLDLVYSGNWVINSVRGSERFVEYDVLMSKLFSYCGLDELVEAKVPALSENISTAAYMK